MEGMEARVDRVDRVDRVEGVDRVSLRVEGEDRVESVDTVGWTEGHSREPVLSLLNRSCERDWWETQLSTVD
jgi:hypothetical protein